MEVTADGQRITKKGKSEAPDESSPTTTQEINIYLKVMKTIKMGVNISDTIEDVKAKYRNMAGGDISDNQELFFDGNHLKNDKKLIDYGVHDDSTVHLFLKSEDRMQIHIKTNFDKTEIYKLSVLKRDTVQKIKAMLRDTLEFPHRQLDLLYSGKHLEDCQTLVFYNIQDDSILDAVFADVTKFEVEVAIPKNGIIKMDVKLSYSVKDVKMLIESMVGIPVGEQELFCATEHLDCDFKRLAAYSIWKGRPLRLIFVKTFSGKTLSIEVESSNTIKNLKQKIEEKLGIPSDGQIFSFAGKSLMDDHTLEQYHIQKDCAVYLIIRLNGG